MRCELCSCNFDEKSAGRSCIGCSMFGGCNLVKCPKCGYEMLPEASEPKWIKRIKKGLRKEKDK
tara:strand:+ start:658 stop:849 length:192 start_codon:yes stop_codon:yes gene_type:complete